MKRSFMAKIDHIRPFDNSLSMVLKISDGPENLIDRHIGVSITMEEFIRHLPEQTVRSLHQKLNEHFLIKK